MTADQIRQNIRDLEVGKNPPIRQVPTNDDLQDKYNEITRGSIEAPDARNPEKIWRELPDGTRVLWRDASGKAEGPVMNVVYPPDSPGRPCMLRSHP